MQKHLLLILIALCCVVNLRAGDHISEFLSGTYQVGNSQTYKKLTDVAKALNKLGVAVTGNVVFELGGDYDGTTGETFPIVFNQFIVSGGSWTVTIRPKAGVTMRTTSGNPGTQALITLNGTDRIIFDGRAGGTGDIAWLIRNEAATEPVATILFQNDAQRNTLTWLQLEGGSFDAGVVQLGTSGTEGNDYNTISYCTIRDRTDFSDPDMPAIGILSVGSEATNGTTIDHNNIFNFYNSGGDAYGIRLAQGTTAASVTHNSIYQTRTLINGSTQTCFYGICIAEWVATQVVLSDNFIGGSAPQCGGSPLTIVSPGQNFCSMTGIIFGVLNADRGSNVCSNNTIRNIHITAQEVNSILIPVFDGIRIEGSRLDVTNNTIGNTEGHDDIKITVNGGLHFTTRMIYFYSVAGGSITGNKTGGITIGGSMTSVIPNRFYGICVSYEGAAPDQTFAVNNNIIGSATIPDNIRSVSASLPLSFSGIAAFMSDNTIGRCINNTIAGISLGYSGTTAAPLVGGIEWISSPVFMDSNLVSDISSAASALRVPTGEELDESFYNLNGINCSSGSFVISNNTVRRLRLTGTIPMNATATQNTNVCGIRTWFSSATSVHNNKIYDLTSANNLGPSSATVIAGIDIYFGGIDGAAIYNNLISLDNGNNTNNCEVRGIRIMPSEHAPVDKLYHNTIYVGGSSGDPSNKAVSYLVSRSSTYKYATGIPSLLLRNNLLVNGRTGGSGPHYVFHNTIPDFALNWTTATSDTNVLVTADASRIARWGTADLDSAQWKTTGGDAHSWFYTTAQIAPANLFTDHATGDLSIKANARKYVAGKGAVSAGITTDFVGETRSTTAPTIGAYEYLSVPNEAPIITSHGGNAAATLPVPENITIVTTMTATDDDAGSLVYSLAGGEDVAKFKVDSSTGVLSFLTAPDFEQPGDANADNVYVATVQVSDGDLIAVQRFKIRVTDANDHAPVITSYNGDAAVMLRVPENTTTVIATVTATDADNNTVITYSLVSEEDAAQFDVNPSTGELSFVTPPPDFEQPRDTNGDNVYIVTVKASDGNSSATQRFKVKLTNENDHAPVITSHNGDALVSLQLPENTVQVSTVTATDADGTAVTYSILSEKDGVLFSVNASTGELRFITLPDYDHPADANGDNTYLVSVQASDGNLSAVQRFSIKITGLDDNPPVATMTINVPENTVEVTALEGTDDDAGSSVVFTVMGQEDGALFWINPANGSLEFKTAPDFEQPDDTDHDNLYLVSVKMTAGDIITILRFKVKVADTNGAAARTTGRTANQPEVQSTVVLQMEATPEPGKSISVYPNPVTGKQFNLRMNGMVAGMYTLDIYTAAGQLVCRQQLSHTGKSVLYPVQLPAALARGSYVLKLMGGDTRHTEKLIIQ